MNELTEDRAEYAGVPKNEMFQPEPKQTICRDCHGTGVYSSPFIVGLNLYTNSECKACGGTGHVEA